jgi:hypothetical protein
MSVVTCPFCGKVFPVNEHCEATHPSPARCPMSAMNLVDSDWNMRPPEKKSCPPKQEAPPQKIGLEVEWGNT